MLSDPLAMTGVFTLGVAAGSLIDHARHSHMVNEWRKANAIAITDRHGKIVWVNQAFTSMTSYSKGETLGKTPRLLKSGA